MQQPPTPNPYEGLPPNARNRWVCVYPAYINAKKTVQEGRRIPKDKAVDNPLCTEIRDTCISQGLTVEVEPKHFPREQVRDHIHSGRVRVQLKNEDSSPSNPNLRTKKELFLMLGSLIPKLKTRQGKGGGGGAEGGGGSQGTKKKKGKRK